ncbi:hypothetical protein AB834_02815 [PVC group bacterium (ex Bugula neritina AB1)]|nr:hypothetical protein AB834_02815 [PVC group bacterium (ex Bugula neritina AB1)]
MVQEKIQVQPVFDEKQCNIATASEAYDSSQKEETLFSAIQKTSEETSAEVSVLKDIERSLGETSKPTITLNIENIQSHLQKLKRANPAKQNTTTQALIKNIEKVEENLEKITLFSTQLEKAPIFFGRYNDTPRSPKMISLTNTMIRSIKDTDKAFNHLLSVKVPSANLLSLDKANTSLETILSFMPKIKESKEAGIHFAQDLSSYQVAKILWEDIKEKTYISTKKLSSTEFSSSLTSTLNSEYDIDDDVNNPAPDTKSTQVSTDSDQTLLSDTPTEPTVHAENTQTSIDLSLAIKEAQNKIEVALINQNQEQRKLYTNFFKEFSEMEVYTDLNNTDYYKTESIEEEEILETSEKGSKLRPFTYSRNDLLDQFKPPHNQLKKINKDSLISIISKQDQGNTLLSELEKELFKKEQGIHNPPKGSPFHRILNKDRVGLSQTKLINKTMQTLLEKKSITPYFFIHEDLDLSLESQMPFPVMRHKNIIIFSQTFLKFLRGCPDSSLYISFLIKEHLFDMYHLYEKTYNLKESKEEDNINYLIRRTAFALSGFTFKNSVKIIQTEQLWITKLLNFKSNDKFIKKDIFINILNINVFEVFELEMTVYPYLIFS